MFLKRERTETDDFVIKKYLKEKSIAVSLFQEITKIFKSLADTLTKIFEIYLHILAFHNIISIFYFFPNKNLHFLSRGGCPPIPP